MDSPSAQAREEARLAANFSETLAGYNRNGTGEWKPTIITAHDLCQKDFPEPRWAIPGIVPEGTTLLCGKPKMGKSWMALGLGIAVASGGVALGSIRVDAGDVLYLSLEDNERRLKKRIKKILPDGDIPPRLHLTTEWPKVGEGCRGYIAQWLRQTPDARMVIIDTLKKIRPNRGNRDMYDADYEMGASLQVLSHQHNVAFLIVHHLRKADAVDDPMDMISGSTGLTGSVDGSLVLVRARSEADAILHISGRDIEDDAPLSLKFDQATAIWEKVGLAVDMDMTPERQRIMSVMRAAGGSITAKQVAARIGKEYETIRKRMAAMEKEGDIKIESGDRNSGYRYVVATPPIPTANYTNYPNLDDEEGEAGTVGTVGSGISYAYTLKEGGGGNYRTDTQDLEVARAALLNTYGDRLLDVTKIGSR